MTVNLALNVTNPAAQLLDRRARLSSGPADGGTKIGGGGSGGLGHLSAERP
jgi:hypothetical protein